MAQFYLPPEPSSQSEVVACTVFAFDRNPENGGVSAKIGMWQCQAAQIAKRGIKESRLDEEGNFKYDGAIICKKGDAYMVDCNVIGADKDTSDKPKFDDQ